MPLGLWLCWSAWPLERCTSKPPCDRGRRRGKKRPRTRQRRQRCCQNDDLLLGAAHQRRPKRQRSFNNLEHVMCARDLFCPWQRYNTMFVGHNYCPFFLRELKASCFSGSLLHVGDRLYECSFLRTCTLRPGVMYQQFPQWLPVKGFTRLHCYLMHLTCCCCQACCAMVTGSHTFLSALALHPPAPHSIRSQTLHFRCLGRRFGAGGSTTCCLPCTELGVCLLDLSVQDLFGGDARWWRYFRHRNLHAELVPSCSVAALRSSFLPAVAVELQRLAAVAEQWALLEVGRCDLAQGP